MVRGCEKRIYYVKNTESEIFDEAYLILRRGKRQTDAGCDMDAEARRIVNGMTNRVPEKREKRWLFSFFAGMMFGATLAGALGLVFGLIP